MYKMVDVGILIGVIGCLVGLAGWLGSRDRKTDKDAEWRGTVTGKLDGIQLSVSGMQGRQDKMDDKVDEVDKRLTRVEESTKSAHHRIDKITGERGE